MMIKREPSIFARIVSASDGGQFWGGPFTDRMIKLARAHRGIRRTLRELVAGDQGYLNLKRTLARRALNPF